MHEGSGQVADACFDSIIGMDNANLLRENGLLKKEIQKLRKILLGSDIRLPEVSPSENQTENSNKGEAKRLSIRGDASESRDIKLAKRAKMEKMTAHNSLTKQKSDSQVVGETILETEHFVFCPPTGKHCKRCDKFGCVYSPVCKGRGGEKHCEFITADGYLNPSFPGKRCCKRCLRHKYIFAIKCPGRGGENKCRFFKRVGADTS